MRLAHGISASTSFRSLPGPSIVRNAIDTTYIGKALLTAIPCMVRFSTIRSTIKRHITGSYSLQARMKVWVKKATQYVESRLPVYNND